MCVIEFDRLVQQSVAHDLKGKQRSQQRNATSPHFIVSLAKSIVERFERGRFVQFLIERFGKAKQFQELFKRSMSVSLGG